MITLCRLRPTESNPAEQFWMELPDPDQANDLHWEKTQVVSVDYLQKFITEDLLIEIARGMNLEAGRQRGLTEEDDWDTITEQERGAWLLMAKAAVAAMEIK